MRSLRSPLRAVTTSAALVIAVVSGVLAACSSSSDGASPPPASTTGDASVDDAVTSQVPTGDPSDVPIDGVTHDEVVLFNEGDALFDLHLREADGLGPLYTQTSCGACHEGAARGPGLVQKMAVVEADGVTPAPAPDQSSKLPYGATVHPLLAAGAKTPITPPPNDPSIKVSIRIGPPLLGRGYMEAILDSEIERVAAEQASRSDGIHGRVNRVTYASEENPDKRFHQHKKGDNVIGRFGLKARIATLDDFVADAFQGDMGITSPLRPSEIANPDNLTDDIKPGVDVGIDSVNKRALYIRYIAIPRRPAASDPAAIRGRTLFDQAKCQVCHTPSMKTRPDYPIALLSNIDAPIFADLLLHDMGTALADGTPSGTDGDGSATSRTWRTSPLIGLRFLRTYLHDGRAKTIHDAILMHDGPGSEASESAKAYASMNGADQQSLLAYVSAL